MNSELQDLHDLCAPYALDALDAHERGLFEEHLADCDTCRDELRGFTATAAHLAEAAVVAPPASLRRNVLAAVSHLRQEPPVVTTMTNYRRRRWISRTVLAAAVLTAIVGVGGYVVERDRVADLQSEQTAAQAREIQMTEIMTAADARRSYQTLDDGSAVTMIGSAEHNAAVVIAGRVPESEDTDLQLWRIRNDRPESAGLVSAGSSMSLIGDVGAQDLIALTVEPAGGSDQPTSEPIAVMSLQDTNGT